MKQSGACPKCKSSNIIEDARMLAGRGTGSRDLSLETYLNPDGFLTRGMRRTELTAWVCSDCGFVEIYATKPKDLIQE